MLLFCFFFPENRDETDEMSAKINDSLKFVYSVFISMGKIQHLPNEERFVCMKEGSGLFGSICSE